MSNEQLDELQILKKRLEARFEKIPLVYYFAFGGVFPALYFFVIDWTINPTIHLTFNSLPMIAIAILALIGGFTVFTMGFLVMILMTLVTISWIKRKAVGSFAQAVAYVFKHNENIPKHVVDKMFEDYEHMKVMKGDEIETIKERLSKVELAIKKPDHIIICSCEKCGTEFKAIPPENTHTKMNVKGCSICYWLKELVPVYFKCSKCEYINIRYYHEPKAHSLHEHIRAFSHKIRKI